MTNNMGKSCALNVYLIFHDFSHEIQKSGWESCDEFSKDRVR